MLELSVNCDLQAQQMLMVAGLLAWATAMVLPMAWSYWRAIASPSVGIENNQPSGVGVPGAGVPGVGSRTIAVKLWQQFGMLRAIGFEGLLILLTCLHLALWQLTFESPDRNRISIGLLIVGVMTSVSVWRWLQHDRGRSQWKLSLSLAVSIAQVAGLATLLTVSSKTNSPSFDPLLVPGEVVAKAEWFAVTEQGNRIGLYERKLPTEKFAEFLEDIRPHIASLTTRAIRRNSAVIEANCHGWVFAKGQHIVRNDDVQKILNENGFVAQTCPRIGDVAVYKSLEGDVIHTGVVCGLTEDSNVLVESKWGVEGCFVHLAEQQPYSQEISYWRSPRSTNTLDIYHLNASGEAHQVYPADTDKVGEELSVLDN